MLLSTSAFAHGSVAQQASDAVSKAVESFTAANPSEVRRQFLSISAELTGHEQFSVTITLKDRATQFKYDCKENEDADPVIWECAAI